MNETVKNVLILQFLKGVTKVILQRHLITNKKIKKMKKLVSWIEIPAEDMERAVKFYNAVLNLSLKIDDFGVEKMACFDTGEGAISQAAGFKPSADGVLVSFNVPDDLESTIERIIAMGGSVLIPKTKIEAEGRGYFAVFIDSEGNKAGLYGEK